MTQDLSTKWQLSRLEMGVLAPWPVNVRGQPCVDLRVPLGDTNMVLELRFTILPKPWLQFSLGTFIQSFLPWGSLAGYWEEEVRIFPQHQLDAGPWSVIFPAFHMPAWPQGTQTHVISSALAMGVFTVHMWAPLPMIWTKSGPSDTCHLPAQTHIVPRNTYTCTYMHPHPGLLSFMNYYFVIQFYRFHRLWNFPSAGFPPPLLSLLLLQRVVLHEQS